MKEVAAILLAKIAKRHKRRHDYTRIDALVGTILIVATLPIALANWIMGQGLAIRQLSLIIGQLLLTGLLLYLLEYLARPKHTRHRHVINLAGLVLSLVSRPVLALGSSAHDSRVVAKLAMTAALPLAMGIIIKLAANTPSIDLHNYLDQLMEVAMLGVVLLISMEFLEKLFRTKSLHLSAYLRIVLGIVIIFMLTRPSGL